MTDRRRALLAVLADGARHSGAELGAALGCTRAAVWKQIAALRSMGLGVTAERGLGYCLPGGADLLERGRLVALLPDATRAALARLEVSFQLESTSATLLATPPPAPGELVACLAEYQTGGRGRRGRQWLSPATRGLCLSVGWRLERGGRDLPALSLAAGVAVLGALRASGATGLRLKWPNDVMAGDGKLGGLLVDVIGEAGGSLYVVTGVGINVSAAPAAGSPALASGLPPATLATTLQPGQVPDRNALAAAVIGALHAALVTFEAEGFAPFAATFRAADYLAGRDIVVGGAGPDLAATARGIQTDGSLLVDINGERRALVAGDISLRPRP
jgi:BirA family biotin operon repressor/biotin-[acetyl-CoA-carboxylase] ligase